MISVILLYFGAVKSTSTLFGSAILAPSIEVGQAEKVESTDPGENKLR